MNEIAYEYLEKFNERARRPNIRRVPLRKKLDRVREAAWLRCAASAHGNLRAARQDGANGKKAAGEYLAAAAALGREMLRLGRRNFSLLERHRYGEDLDGLLRQAKAGYSDEAADGLGKVLGALTDRTPTRRPFSPKGPKGWVEVQKPKDPSDGPHTVVMVLPEDAFREGQTEAELRFEGRLTTRPVRVAGKPARRVTLAEATREDEAALGEIFHG